MLSTLDQIWLRAGLRDHVIGYDETRRWPKDERERIFALGILRRREDAEAVQCDACGESHTGEVIYPGDDEADGLISCPRLGVVRVPRERQQQWEVDFAGLAELLKRAFALGGAIQELKPGRVWLMGQRRVGSRVAEFFLIQGASWPDGLDILRSTPRFANSPAPVVLFPGTLPKDPAWQANGRALYSLNELVQLGDSGLVAAIETVEDLYRQIAARREQEIVPTPSHERPGVLKKCLADYGCKLKDICWWTMVQRQDLNAWKLSKPQVPDGGEKANRIERFIQFGVKARA
ncbi:MAG TPA: hypothetical protein PKW45_20700 [Bryobacteraceae bacterium]|nr:hypothetical protein [Bryobacteraceae bacterium]